MSSFERHRVAVFAGDGIGQEVVPGGIRVREAAGRGRTPDLGGSASTQEIGTGIARALAEG